MNTPLKTILVALAGGITLTSAAVDTDPRHDLWDARHEYRYDFVEDNGQYKGDFDKLRDNWTSGATFDPRKTLLRAMDGFIAEIEATDSQEARQLLAETVNELLSGHLSHGNYLLIEALKARFPFIDGDSAEPGRPAEDGWALGANGSVDEEVAEIDKALIQMGIGIKAATSVLGRADGIYDRYTGEGVLRASDASETYAGFPYFIELKDGFRTGPDYEPVAPFATPVRAELAQLTSITERRAQAMFEKGQKFFQTSGQKTGEDRIEARRKAREALKVGHHSSYLLAATLGATQTEEEFVANDGEKIRSFTSQMVQFYKNLDDPNFQPAGNTDQFIPPTDKPVSQYISDAAKAVREALQGEKDYRSQKRDNNARQAEMEEFFLREDEFLDQLKRFTGFNDNEIQNTFGRLLTIDDRRAFRAELENRVGQIIDQGYSPDSPPDVTNLGDFGVQILSVLDSQFRILEAKNTLDNIPRRVQIEEDRSDNVIEIIYSATEKINATEEALAWASSFSVGASTTLSLPPAISASVNFNPLSSVVAGQQRKRSSIQAHQQADIEGANSEATIRSILLDMDNAVIELDRSKILFDQENTKLLLMFADVEKLIEDYSEAVELRRNNAELHFANPEYRRWLNEAYKRAEARRREAIVELYQLGRALGFWWTEEYANPVFKGVGGQSEVLERFNGENFPELLSVFSITTANQLGDFYLLLTEWDSVMRSARSPSHQLTQTRFYSLRDDILFKDLAGGGVSLNRRIRDFRDYLAANAFYGPGSDPHTRPGLRLDFPISMENLDSRQDWNIRVGYLSNYPDGVQAGVRVQIETDAGFNGAEPDANVDLTYFGVISTTTYFDDPEVAKRSVIKWELPAPNSPFAENRDELACSFPASINGRMRLNTSYLCTTFRGKPIASTNWRLTLDTTRKINEQVDISKIRDIKLIITESRGRPVDPVTGNAYAFEGL